MNRRMLARLERGELDFEDYCDMIHLEEADGTPWERSHFLTERNVVRVAEWLAAHPGGRAWLAGSDASALMRDLCVELTSGNAGRAGRARTAIDGLNALYRISIR